MDLNRQRSINCAIVAGAVAAGLTLLTREQCEQFLQEEEVETSDFWPALAGMLNNGGNTKTIIIFLTSSIDEDADLELRASAEQFFKRGQP